MSKKVKRIEIRTETSEGLDYVSEISEYNLQGNMLFQEEYTPEGELESKMEFYYDSEGRLREQKQLIEDNEIADHKIFHRNDSGQVVQTEIYFQDGSKSIQTTRTDAEKNIEELIEQDEDGELESREVNFLNEDKQVILKELYNFDNHLTEAFTYQYNTGGLLIRREQLDHKKKLVLYLEYEYDDQGRTILRTNKNRKGQLSEYLKIEYDEKGQVIKQNFSGKYFFLFEYDSNGNTVLEERYTANTQMEYQSRFEFDENNLLLKEINLEFTRTLNYQFYNE